VKDKFSDGQTFALKQMKKGKNIFLTGEAGSGKTTVIEVFDEEHKGHIAKLAPTGVAAVNIAGETIHSFFKINPYNTDYLYYWKKYTKEMELPVEKRDEDVQKVIEKIQSLDVIELDEIGMVRSDVLSCVDCICQAIKKVSEHFGGIQVIGSGDVYQLAPVVKKDERFKMKRGEEWFFRSPGFILGNFKLIELDKVHRVTGPGQDDFKDALNRFRRGLALVEDIEYLNKRVAKPHPDSLILTSTNNRAWEINKEKLDSIAKRYVSLRAEIHTEPGYDIQMEDFQVPETLYLKVGARVMLLTNNKEGGWFNGTTGVYKGKVRGKDLLIIRTDKGRDIFVHKHTFEKREHIKDANGELKMMTVASVEQFPVKIAYAMTIHKAQGKTLSKVHVDLGKNGAFAHGQTYVALSRVTSYEGLTLEHPLTQDDFLCDPFVRSFMDGVAA